MLLLPVLLLGLALPAPAAVAQKREKKTAAKEERRAAKHEREAQEPAARPAPEPTPERAPEAAPQPDPAPEATPEPVPEATPAPAIPEPAPTAQPVPAPVAPVEPPARTAAPRTRPAELPARPRARRSAPRRSMAAPQTVPVAAPAPRGTPASPVHPRSAWARREVAAVTPRPPVAVEAVTRVIRVIPGPLRIAIAALLLVALGLAARARWLVRQRRGLRDDLGLLQSALLPVLPGRIAGAEVSAAYRPAEGLAAGGDFYDAFALDDHRTCVLVGDVAGHGRDAVPLTADVRFTLRAYLEGGLGARAALAAAAGVLEPRLQGRTVTVVVGVYDALAGTLTYASAGHPPPLLVGVGERLLTAGGCPALGSGLPTAQRQTTVALPPAATAIFHTDGLTDVLRHGRRMGRAGLAEAVRPGGDADALLERLLENGVPQPDDMAACVLRPAAGAVHAEITRVEELHVGDDHARAEVFLRACGLSSTQLPPGPAVLEVRDGELTVRTAQEAVLPLG